MEAIEERISNLERRMVAVERRLDSAPGTGTPRGKSEGENPGPNAHRSDISNAEALFDELTESERLISYSEAYRRLIGPYDTWRNAIHPAEVIRVARRMRSREVCGLPIRLDALIVSKQTRRPGGGLFKEADYNEAAWIRAFGTWPLID